MKHGDAQIAALEAPCRTRERRDSGPRATVVFIVGCCLVGVPPALADDARSLHQLAGQARQTLAERIEPPVAQLPLVCTSRRNESAPMREYILHQQAEAIDALVASAGTPEETQRVRRLLGKLQRDGHANEAAAWLADSAPGGAAGLRLATSLGELPAALHPRLWPGGRCGTAWLGLLGRTLQPLGARARADYTRLAELEPTDAWHGLVLAWLFGIEGEPALQRALAQAQSQQGDDAVRVQIFAWQQLAWLRLEQGRDAEALPAATRAMQLADSRLLAIGHELAQPAVAQAARDAATARSMVALVLDDTGQKAAASAMLQDLAARQRQLAGLRPGGAPAQLALIDTLGRLAVLQGATGAAAAKPYLDEAVKRYRQLEQRTPYSPMITLSNWRGMLLGAAAAAAALTLVAGLALLRRYRWRIAQLMNASSRVAAAPLPAAGEALPPSAAAPAARPGNAATLRQAAMAQRRAALVQLAAGLLFGGAAAWLQLHAYELEPTLHRLALMGWTWAWPTVLALGLVWDGDRRRRRLAWALYFAGLLLICGAIALADNPPLAIFGITLPAFFQALMFWAISLSYSPLLLLFLNRAVRSIGPALLLMMLMLMLGTQLALVAASTPAGMAAVASLLGAVHLPAPAFFPIVMSAGVLLAAPLAWWLGRRLRAAYAARWLSDQSLVIDTLWGFQSVVLALELSSSIGPTGWFALGLFGLHKAATLAGMAATVRAARHRSPLRLLLLRVFARRDRSGRIHSRRADAERLFDLLGARWRYAGPITMIGAPDLASSTIDPDEFLDFLAGRLHERFIADPAELPARLAAIDDERCDLDARWRVSELFCGNDSWRAAVLALMARSDLVAMDLRDFGPNNQGCLFELQSLIDLVPADRVALLVDASTQHEHLQAAIERCLACVPATSPNAGARATPELIEVGHGEQAAVDRLLHKAA